MTGPENRTGPDGRCNGLGIMRACLETQKQEQLEARMDEITDRVARDKTSTHEAQRPSH